MRRGARQDPPPEAFAPDGPPPADSWLSSGSGPVDRASSTSRTPSEPLDLVTGGEQARTCGGGGGGGGGCKCVSV